MLLRNLSTAARYESPRRTRYGDARMRTTSSEDVRTYRVSHSKRKKIKPPHTYTHTDAIWPPAPELAPQIGLNARNVLVRPIRSFHSSIHSFGIKLRPKPLGSLRAPSSPARCICIFQTRTYITTHHPTTNDSEIPILLGQLPSPKAERVSKTENPTVSPPPHYTSPGLLITPSFTQSRVHRR